MRRRTRRATVVASIIIVAALGMTWFIWAVAWPVWQVRAIVTYETPEEEAEDAAQVNMKMAKDIERLGGEERAAARLGSYLRLPNLIAPKKHCAAFLLEGCGKAGIPVLAGCLGTRDPELRGAALGSLRDIALNERDHDFDATAAVARLLAGTLDSGDRQEMLDTIGILEQLGRAADCAKPQLEKLLKHPDKEVRDAAAAALAKLRGGEKAK